MLKSPQKSESLMAESDRIKKPNRKRHERDCSICSHPRREEIERDFIEWESPTRIVQEYGLTARSIVYRHARALGLFAKRDHNIRAGLARIIERGGDVEVTASAVVAAIQAYAKINAAGQWVDRSEHVSLNELFERMSKEELEKYARDGELPDWFERTVSGTPAYSPKIDGGLE